MTQQKLTKKELEDILIDETSCFVCIIQDCVKNDENLTPLICDNCGADVAVCETHERRDLKCPGCQEVFWQVR